MAPLIATPPKTEVEVVTKGILVGCTIVGMGYMGLYSEIVVPSEATAQDETDGQPGTKAHPRTEVQPGTEA